jgi:hypothetical protein
MLNQIKGYSIVVPNGHQAISIVRSTMLAWNGFIEPTNKICQRSSSSFLHNVILLDEDEEKKKDDTKNNLPRLLSVFSIILNKRVLHRTSIIDILMYEQILLRGECNQGFPKD